MAKKKTEVTKQPEQTTERLAFMLNQCYTQIMKSHADINAINKELERRQKAKEQENGKNTD